MQNLFLALVAIVLFLTTSGAQAATPNPTPLEIVNLRMKFYNEHNIEAMLALYSEDVEVFTYPDRLLGKGKSHLRRVLDEIFADKSVRVTIPVQLAKDGFVVNEELVAYAAKPMRYVSIYEVRDGLIRSVRFVRD